MTVDYGHFPDLGALSEFIGDCQRCPLARCRTTLVFGVGKPDADVMFIGEGPGRNEDLKGEPFVGAAGQLLDELLGSIGLHRSDVYIANIVKCRPPNNRDPEPIEIETCTPFLREQIRLIDPSVIVTLGKFATQWVLQTEVGITRLRGRRHEVDGRAVLPIFHPAAALYDQSKRSVLFDDFRRLNVLLDAELGGPAPAAQAGESESAADKVTDSGAVTVSAAGDGGGDDPPAAEAAQGTLF